MRNFYSMDSGFDVFKSKAFQGVRRSAGATSVFAAGAVQGGAFAFYDVTIGMMLSPLASWRRMGLS